LTLRVAIEGARDCANLRKVSRSGFWEGVGGGGEWQGKRGRGGAKEGFDSKRLKMLIRQGS